MANPLDTQLPNQFGPNTLDAVSLNLLRMGTVAGEYPPSVWFSGITPTDYYLIYKGSAIVGGCPLVYAPPTSTELIRLANSFGVEISTEAEALNKLAIAGYYPGNRPFSNLVMSNLALFLTPRNTISYPTSGVNWYDLSGDFIPNPFTIDNSAMWNQGGWFDFDGTDEYAKTVNQIVNSPSVLTIGANFKRSINNTDTDIETVLHCSSTNTVGSSNYWVGTFSTGGGNLITATIGANTGGISYQAGNSGVTATNGRWYNVISTWDGSDVRVYVNGVEEATYALSSYTSTAGAPTRVGSSSDGSNYQFEGGVGDVFINATSSYTEAQVLQNYHQAPIVTDDLVLACDAGNIVSYESGSITTYNLSQEAAYSGIDGTLNNDVSGSDFGVPHFGFDGTDDFIDFGDNFDLIGDNISGFVWGWADSFTNTTPWIDKLKNSGNYRLTSNSSGYLQFGIRDSSGTFESTTATATPQPTGEWCMIGFTYDNTSKKAILYKDGVVIGGTNFTITRGNTGNEFRIGYSENNSTRLDGRVGQILLYNKKLSKAEVLQNYNALATKYK